LRDGLQSPGISLSLEERVEVAGQLARLSVDAIEVGFPALGAGEFEAVQAVARRVQGPVVKALARALVSDVETAWSAVRDAEHPRVTIYIPTSDVQIRHRLGTSREDVIERTMNAICHARSLTEEIEFSPMDATRTEPMFLAEVVTVAIEAGAAIVSVPDTMGATTPDEFRALLEGLRQMAPRIGEVTLGVHCHNGRGLAVENSLAGVMAGARSVEGTINGIGDRTGNASLEELVTLIHARSESLGVHTGINMGELEPTSRLASRLTGR
jgi:2-isopropylmalate synthase